MKVKRGSGEIIFDVLNYTLLILLAIVTIYPFWHTLVLSISARESAMGMSFRLWPTKLDFTSWEMIAGRSYMWNGFYNTVVRTVLGTAIAVILTVTTAYPLAKKTFPHRDFFTGLIIFTMLFGGGMIPTYVLVSGLGLMDSVWALVIPAAISPFNVVIVRNFFQSIPESLEESARIDGANDMLILWRIVLPLSTPVLATITLWILVGHWNAWFDAVLYIHDRGKFVLQQLLRELVVMNTVDPHIAVPQSDTAVPPMAESVKSAATMFATIPILIVYPFLQKYFTQGIMIGALKG
ncbi:carbohydrate ABC transporter permease [Mahella australiensis]|uniref:Binding-protein-dependent transport systems inner membrane component n=1 Tax=Mahella australiensis (strain DSM 15567 / CIP 107919 / 50-1 BON) TaxID=697281 RepID=F3ZWT3_MAHA5|nr:carbohydrate ABC transporter permease [Mahella australiensis]AEE96526.1 binding-protein-dependent transport systems inner membrane component [Mahella australiensis 50-1 BON]